MKEIKTSAKRVARFAEGLLLPSFLKVCPTIIFRVRSGRQRTCLFSTQLFKSILNMGNCTKRAAFTTGLYLDKEILDLEFVPDAIT